MRVRPLNIVVLFVCLLACFVLVTAPLAFADEPSSSSSSESLAHDYSETLQSIEGKLGGLAAHDDMEELEAAIGKLPTKEDIAGLSDVVKSIAPVDNKERIEALNEFMSALTTLTLFQWVTLLLLLGVVCALVFLVSYRSHT